MNTAPWRMSQLLRECMDNGSLRTEARSYMTCFAQHGDLCIAGGIQASTLTSTARNHDPKHDPYGICLFMASYKRAAGQSSQAQMPQSPWPRQQILPGPVCDDHRPRVWNPQAASASGSATEQALPAPPVPLNTEQHRHTPPTTSPTSETTAPTSGRNEPRGASASGSATEQPLPAPPVPPNTEQHRQTPPRLQLRNLNKKLL